MQFISNLFGYTMGWIMWLIYLVVRNYGVAIILFTLVTKALMFPISVKQQKSMAVMNAFQPKIKALQKKYGNNKEKLQEAQMKLYAEEGINPMGSCLPLLIQFPFLFGIIDVVYRPLTHILHITKDVVLQLTDLAKGVIAADPTAFAGVNADLLDKSYQTQLYVLQAFRHNPEAFSSMGAEFMQRATEFNEHFILFGINLGQNPQWTLPTILIPILAALSQLAVTVYSQIQQKKVNPAASSMGFMNGLMYIMPLFSGWIAFSFPAGVGFYWIWQSAFSLLQSVILYRIYTPEHVAELNKRDAAKKAAKRKNKPTFMQRAMELQKQQEAAARANGGQPLSAREAVKRQLELNDEELEEGERKLSNKEIKDMNRRVIAEARRRMAEKYGEEYQETEDGEE